MKRILCLLLACALLLSVPFAGVAEEKLKFYEWAVFKVRNVDIAMDTQYEVKSGNLMSMSWNGEGYGGYGAREVVSGIDLSLVKQSGDYTYYPLEDGTVALIDIALEHQTKTVTIPGQIDGYTVTRLGMDVNTGVYNTENSGCMFSDNVETVVLPDSIKVIGAGALQKNSGLSKTITLPDSVEEIGAHMLDGDYVYKKLPQNLKRLGNLAFADSQKLKGVTLPASIEDIGVGAFMESNVSKITLPASLKQIGAYAFASAYKLSSVTIKDGVPYISEGMFINCDKLSSITLPASIAAVGDFAFEDCDKLSKITFKGGQLTAIGEGAFKHCAALTSITLPEGVSSIGADAFFDCSKLSKATIPASVTSIGDYAFEGCSSKLTITVTKDSYADQWAGEHGYKVKYKK